MRDNMNNNVNRDINSSVNTNTNSNINRKINKYSVCFISIMFLLMITAISCLGSQTDSDESLNDNILYDEDGAYYYENEDTGYVILFDDQADLLTDEQEDELYSEMYYITEYGHVGFVTINKDRYSAVEDYANDYYHDMFGNDSGTIFLIDMDKRKICIFSDGIIYDTITRDYADTITDNVYRYASNGDYYGCAAAAYQQILTLLDGGRIAQPMKYICNFLLAVIFAMLIIYFYVRTTTNPDKASDRQLMEGLTASCEFTNVTKERTGQSRYYSPRSSGSGSSGGGFSGGGGGGGGGGGSHSF